MISFLFEVIKISTTNNWLIGPRESNQIKNNKEPEEERMSLTRSGELKENLAKKQRDVKYIRLQLCSMALSESTPTSPFIVTCLCGIFRRLETSMLGGFF